MVDPRALVIKTDGKRLQVKKDVKRMNKSGLEAHMPYLRALSMFSRDPKETLPDVYLLDDVGAILVEGIFSEFSVSDAAKEAVEGRLRSLDADLSALDEKCRL